MNHLNLPNVSDPDVVAITTDTACHMSNNTQSVLFDNKYALKMPINDQEKIYLFQKRKSMVPLESDSTTPPYTQFSQTFETGAGPNSVNQSFFHLSSRNCLRLAANLRPKLASNQPIRLQRTINRILSFPTSRNICMKRV